MEEEDATKKNESTSTTEIQTEPEAPKSSTPDLQEKRRALTSSMWSRKNSMEHERVTLLHSSGTLAPPKIPISISPPPEPRPPPESRSSPESKLSKSESKLFPRSSRRNDLTSSSRSAQWRKLDLTFSPRGSGMLSDSLSNFPRRKKSREELKRDIADLKKRLAIYEGENSDRLAKNAEEDRKRIKKIFDMFDTDGSGDITSEEFQDLAYRLGETLTSEEIGNIMRKIDTSGNGTVDFNEFHAWWMTTEHDLSDKSEDKLRILKMKLTSKAYLRALHGFSARIIHMKERQTRLSQDNTLAHLSADLMVGTFQDEKCSISLRLEKDEASAKEIRKPLEAPDNAIALSITMKIRDGIDDFAIGELSGKLKNLFVLNQHQQLVTKVINQDDKRLFIVSTYFDDVDVVDSVIGILEAASLESLEAKLLLSERPWRTMTELPKMKFTANADIPRKSMTFLKSVVGEESKESSWDLGKLDWILLFLKTILNGRLNATFHDFGDLYKAFGGDSDFLASGWTSVRQKLRRSIREFIKDPMMSPPVLDAYHTVIEMIEGIEEFRAQAGSYVLSLDGNDFPLMDLLPNRSELDEEELESEGSDDDDFDD